MNFETFFRVVSYIAVFCGFLSLWVSRTFGIVSTAIFIAVMILAWRLEDTRWQISEKIGTGLIVLALPLFGLMWKFKLLSLDGGEAEIAGILARMILSLTAVKLLQKKSDRDWIFLYLMAFFEVLLAAGLSISALYLASFVAFLLAMVCAIIAFEIRKTSRFVEEKVSGKVNNERDPSSESRLATRVRRLPTTAVTLIVFIVALAIPMFFLLPRVGGAGFGGDKRGSATSGFSNSIRLGRSGRITQTDEVVMRVKLEGVSNNDAGLYFRGVALDTFDNQTWSKSKPGVTAFEKGANDMVQVGLSVNSGSRTVQTIYLEPLDTPVLFALPRAISISGFPLLNKDAYDAISFQPTNERVTYKVISDRELPSAAELRGDDQPYTADAKNYRDLPPNSDPRIAKLAETITAKAKNRYDKAREVESYLQNNFGYTLEMKANGTEPLSDFLFNVREGHCEYFASAMAVLLRTQGIATRVVNGFHGGDYNDTAGMTIVRQKNAHAWVEVFFPKENVWVPFDPTPFAGQPSTFTPSGFAGTVSKYLEALETFWIQHFVAYDDQEQRSLAKTMRNSLINYQTKFSSYMSLAQQRLTEWWSVVRGDKGLQASVVAIAFGAAYLVAAAAGVLLLVLLYRRLKRLPIWQRIWARFFKKRHASIVEFYDRMQRILAEKGQRREPHQTPLEFAFASGIPEVVSITESYNRVRFGEKDLSSSEADKIEDWLKTLKAE